MIQDAMGALKEAILADAAVAALVGTRVFINVVPPGVFGGQRLPTILLRQAGGAGTTGELQVQDLTVDVFCYGATDEQAEQVRRTLFPRLKYLNREVHGGTLLHRCNPASGPTMGHEPEGALPVVQQSWDVLVAEVAAA